ncbi:MAG: NAD(P)H-dependent oxidoreductase [Ideonella sp.]|nr:NAD(P)H-dependent oxidoreductase [Ideonella sp.]
MNPLNVLVMPGSARQASLNRRLAAAAAARLAAAGAGVTTVDWAALDIPLYHGDVEAAGMPAGAVALWRQIAAHDAVLVVTPEYNAFPPPLLVNAFDWVSRVPAADGLPAGLGVTAGKVTGLLSASPGALGGLRSLMFLRQFLQLSIGMLVVPEQFALGQANQAFAEDGRLADARQASGLQRVIDALLRTAGAMRAA